MIRLYAGSDGEYYTEWQVAWRLESGRWRPCMWDTEAGWELVDDGSELVWLLPVSETDLPAWAEVRPAAGGVGAEVVDSRAD